MSRYYDKDALKERLQLEQIYDLIELWGGEPEYSEGGLTSQTICHNPPGVGSRKLYYYENTRLCKCYSGCPESSFDIFDLCIKVMKIQKNLTWELYDAMVYIAGYFGFEGQDIENKEEELEDWKVFKRHDFQMPQSFQTPVLKEYNPVILTRFAYPRIDRWEREGISPDISRKNLIGYYPGGEQIVIPHFDINNRLVGIRGRFLANDMAKRYGKYRPLMVNKQLYSHPLSMNLYNLNNSKKNIKKRHVVIIFEGEKSTLQYQSYYGQDNDISVACCGSSLSSYQVEFLKGLGVNEIILAFDRQFQEIGDEEFKKLKAKLLHIHDKYKNTIKITIIFDKCMITSYKASPIDEGKEKFEQLLKERIFID